MECAMPHPKIRSFRLAAVLAAVLLCLRQSMSDNTVHPLALAALEQLQFDLSDIHADGLRDYFMALRSETRENAKHLTSSFAKMPPNAGKNRYKDVHPYDATRVILNRSAEDEDQGDVNGGQLATDYINANHIHLSNSSRHYIAAQGPLETTQADFWTMVWQYNSRVIVMTTNLFEKGQNKCHCYYPTEDETVREIGHFRITHVSEQADGRTDVTRVFTLVNLKTNEERAITHHHFVAWPDHGVPSSPAQVLRFLEKVRKTCADTGSSLPVTIHCSAGIGRTGTFIVIDACLEQFEKSGGKSIPNVIEVIKEARLQRIDMVQAPEQLEFCFSAIMEGVQIIAHSLAESAPSTAGTSAADSAEPAEPAQNSSPAEPVAVQQSPPHPDDADASAAQQAAPKTSSKRSSSENGLDDSHTKRPRVDSAADAEQTGGSWSFSSVTASLPLLSSEKGTAAAASSGANSDSAPDRSTLADAEDSSQGGLWSWRTGSIAAATAAVLLISFALRRKLRG